MKTFAKSFFGAALATVIILGVVAIFIQDQETDSGSNFNQNYSESGQNNLPVQRTSYSLPQQIDLTDAAEKTVNAVVHIKTEMRVKTSNYDNFFGTFRDYFGNPLSLDDLQKMQDAYYEERGWDIQKGLPNTDKIRDLDLAAYV